MNQPTERTAEQEILARLAAGDPGVLELIWDQHASQLLGYLMSILNSRTDAEDVLQDVMVQIARKHQAVARAEALAPYLFRMARNQAMDFIRRRQRVPEANPDLDRWLAANAEASAYDDDQLRLAHNALQQLPEEQRAVVVLKIYQDRTFREIAELLELSENTVASRYRYAMEKLKAFFRSHAP